MGIPWGFRLARSFAAGFNSTQVIEETARAPEDGMKLIPDTARVIAALPGTALEGERRLSCGAGLFPVDEPPTANGNEEVVPPPGAGFFTETFSVPLTDKSLAGTVA